MKILLIENEEDLAFFIKKSLESAAFAVDLAPDSKTGNQLFSLYDYDAAIIDINLSEENGIEICKKIRSKSKNYPIIMLGTTGEIDEKIEALNSGADDYLTKPFHTSELIAKIRVFMRREAMKIASDRLSHRDIELDLGRYKATKNGKEIPLRKKEFGLLEYFLRNPGMVLSRNMILEHVWDTNADPFTNTVDVHVRLLRKKLEDNSDDKLIRTVHGMGYCLD